MAIYLETSILLRLPPGDIGTAEFLHLKGYCEILKIPILIPEVAFLEWISKIQEQIVDNFTKVDGAVEKISKLSKTKPHLSLPKKRETILKQVKKHLMSQLNNLDVQIVRTPRISLKHLLKMSVNKTRPFEEKKEKGFRDSVILLTVLKHGQKEGKGYHFFITADKGYDHQDVYDQAKSHEVTLKIFDSISSIADHLEKMLDGAVRTYLNTRAQKIKEFLMTQINEIMNYIRTKNKIALGTISEETEFRDVKSIISIEFLEITKVVTGELEGAQDGKVKISFWVKLRFSAIIESPAYAISALLGITFQKNEETGTWDRDYGRLSLPPKEIGSSFEHSVLVEASIVLNKETDEYSNLEIESISI